MLTRLEQDLARLGPADRVAVAAYDGRDLTRITDWTGSRDEIENALLQARKRKAHGLLRLSGMGYSQGDKTRRSVMAAAGTVRSFANAPGRKVMLLLIEGWAGAYNPWNAQSSLWADTAGIRLDRLYAPLVHAANLVGYSLYPIDLPGLQPRLVSAISAPGFGSFGNSQEDLFHDVLRYLAKETGGLPMINSFSKKALAETTEDTRSYYWLGFEPPRNEDDRLHDIRVRIAGRRDLRVRTREHYLDMSKGTEVTMLVEGALLFGGAPGAESLEVHFGTPRRAGFRRIFVPMRVTIPLDDVELLPMNGQWMNELEFRIRLMDRFGEQAVPPAAKLPILIPNEPRPGDLFVFETDLRLRKRKHRYVAAIYDPLTGGLVSASGTVGPQ